MCLPCKHYILMCIPSFIMAWKALHPWNPSTVSTSPFPQTVQPPKEKDNFNMFTLSITSLVFTWVRPSKSGWLMITTVYRGTFKSWTKQYSLFLSKERFPFDSLNDINQLTRTPDVTTQPFALKIPNSRVFACPLSFFLLCSQTIDSLLQRALLNGY